MAALEKHLTAKNVMTDEIRAHLDQAKAAEKSSG